MLLPAVTQILNLVVEARKLHGRCGKPFLQFAFSVESHFTPFNVDSNAFALIEHFVCVMYDHTTNQTCVNHLRQDLFALGKNVKMMQNLPLTQDALCLHANRSLYKASICLSSLKSYLNVPSPEQFGWSKVDGIWQPIWTTLPEVAKSCRELIHCGCKAMPLCKKNCVCRNSSSNAHLFAAV